MKMKLLGALGIAAVAFSSTLVFAVDAAGPDMLGAWECSAMDNMQHVWVHEGPNQTMAQTWALGVCDRDSPHPHSCHLPAKACYPVVVKGNWRCFASDDRETIHWNQTRVAPRWHAVHAAYQRCYTHSSHPKTCYVNPAQCVYHR